MSLRFSNEHQLLLCCSRLDLASGKRGELHRLLEQRELSWQYVIGEAHRHRVSAFLFRHLRHGAPEGTVPFEAMQKLKDAYYQNLHRNLILVSELRQVLQALQQSGIPAIVLKGAALTAEVYGDIGLRPMRDLDLLVTQEDANAAYSVVREVGYEPKESTERQLWRRFHHQHLSQLFSQGKPSIVELHTHIVEPANALRFDIAGFWERAREADVGGTDALTLSPEDLLTHLSVHFFWDRGASCYAALGQLCDVAQVVRRFGDLIDWDLLCREVTPSPLRGPVFCGLYFAQLLLDAPVPRPVLECLKPPNFSWRDAEPFVRRRILGKKVMAKRLIAPEAPYRWRAIPPAIVRRVLASQPRRTDDHHGEVPPKKTGRPAYVDQLRAALSLATSSIGNPIGAYEDIASDRWLHSLYSAQHSSQPHAAVSGSLAKICASEYRGQRYDVPIGNSRKKGV